MEPAAPTSWDVPSKGWLNGEGAIVEGEAKSVGVAKRKVRGVLRL
jgi:hypothetical protein